MHAPHRELAVRYAEAFKKYLTEANIRASLVVEKEQLVNLPFHSEFTAEEIKTSLGILRRSYFKSQIGAIGTKVYNGLELLYAEG
jgi:predicted  nucleic acid-binding Zn ribbon protein